MSGFREHPEGPRHFFSEETDGKALEVGRMGDDRQDSTWLALHADASFHFQIRRRQWWILLLDRWRPEPYLSDGPDGTGKKPGNFFHRNRPSSRRAEPGNENPPRDVQSAEFARSIGINRAPVVERQRCGRRVARVVTNALPSADAVSAGRRR